MLLFDCPQLAVDTGNGLVSLTHGHGVILSGAVNLVLPVAAESLDWIVVWHMAPYLKDLTSSVLKNRGFGQLDDVGNGDHV